MVDLNIKRNICRKYERKLLRLTKRYNKLKNEKIELINENDSLKKQLQDLNNKYGIREKRISKPYEVYKIIGLVDNLFKFSNGHLSSFNISQISEIKDNLYNYTEYPTISSFQEIVYLTEPSLERLVWNIEQGIFDRYL